MLVGAGEWGRDGGRPHPYPPPVTTIAWRMHHLTEMLAGRADWTVGSHSFDEDEMVVRNDAASAIDALRSAVAAWRAEDPFLEIVWWVNQEVLHHGAEIALLRDLHRATHA